MLATMQIRSFSLYIQIYILSQLDSDLDMAIIQIFKNKITDKCFALCFQMTLVCFGQWLQLSTFDFLVSLSSFSLNQFLRHLILFVLEQERKYNKNKSMSSIQVLAENCLYQLLVSRLLPTKSPLPLTSFSNNLYSSLEIVRVALTNSQNFQSYPILLNNQFEVQSKRDKQVFEDQPVKISDFLYKNYGKLYEVLAYLIVKLHLASHDKSEFAWTYLGERTEDLSRILQKLRFQIYMENIKQQQSSTIVNFDELIKHIFMALAEDLSFPRSSLHIFHQALKLEQSNISDKLLEQIASYFSEAVFGVSQMDMQGEEGQKKNLKGLDLFIKRSQKKHNTLEQKKQGSKNAEYNSEKFKKKKFILKERTIYHKRENIFIAKKKSYDNSEKSVSIDQSTQYSFSLPRVTRSFQDFNSQDFEENVLAAKTPKNNRIYFARHQKPISFRLDFSF